MDRRGRHALAKWALEGRASMPSASWGAMKQKFGRREYGDTLILPQVQQMTVTGDDDLDLRRRGAGEHRIVIGISKDNRTDRRGLNQPCQGGVSEDKIMGRDAGQFEALGELRTAQDVFELRQQDGAGKDV